MLETPMTRAAELQLSSGRLHALRAGPENGAPVICVPGLSAKRAQLRRDRGDARSRRPPGPCPRSARPRPQSRHRPRYARLAPPRRRRAGTASKLGFASFDLVGHSMGAFVSMQAAALEAGTDPAPGPDRRRRRSRTGRAPAIVLQCSDWTWSTRPRTTTSPSSSGTARRQPWEDLWEAHYRSDLEPVASGVRPRTSKAAVVEDSSTPRSRTRGASGRP